MRSVVALFRWTTQKGRHKILARVVFPSKETYVLYFYPIGRILFAYIFISAGPGHFTHERIAHAADLGAPLAGILVPISGAMALIGGIIVALGYKTRWGAWLLVGFLVPVTLMMHG